MLGAARLMRMKRELALFEDRPPHGISCWVKNDETGQLAAQIVGGDETPYRGGIFTLDIHLPDRYPFEPPKINFITPIYHPNVDTGGRICLESLKMPPNGSWSPVLNIVTVLTTIQLLMAEPNPDDPLMADIAKEFKYNPAQYEQAARLWTERHAMSDRPAAQSHAAEGNDTSIGRNFQDKVIDVNMPNRAVANVHDELSLENRRPVENVSDSAETTRKLLLGKRPSTSQHTSPGKNKLTKS